MAEYVKGQRVRFTTGNLGVLDSFGRPTDDTVGERTDYTHGMYFGRHDPLDDWHVIAVDINGDERYAPVHESMFEVTTISESIDRIRDAYQAWSVIPPSDRARERNATANLHDATGALRDLYDNEHREQLRTRLSAAADAWCDATDGDDQAPLTDQIDHAHQLHAATTAYLAEHHADDPTRGPDGHPVWGTITITDRGGSWGAHLPAEPPAQVILRCINQEFESMGREGVVTAFSVLPGKFQVVTVTYVMPPLKAGGKFQHRHAVYVDGVCQSSGISGHTDNGANV